MELDSAEIARRIFRWVVAKKDDERRKDDTPERGRTVPLSRLMRPAILSLIPTPWPPEIDCDELAMYIGSMLLSIGVPCEFVTIADDVADPTRFTHVYVQAILEDGSKMPLDPYCDKPGEEPPLRFRRKEWGVIRPRSAITASVGENGTATQRA
jgi:hypothetical protein